MKRIGKLSAIAVVSLCLFALVSFAASAVELTDIGGHWAKEYIEYGVEKGYISGYADGTFLPDKTVTRAEFSKMINNAVGLTAVGDAKADFNDVKASEWYFNEVKKAENAGYITGYEDGTFRPSNSVTRQEAAVILSRIVLPVSERANINSFGDGNSIDTWATDAVTMIAAKGYIKGDENSNFLPKGALTRSQAAKLICEFVKNENIVNRNQNITEAGKEIVYSETLFTDDVVIDIEDAEELTVEFKNCRVLGNVYIKTADTSVMLENAKVKNLYVDEEDIDVSLDKTSEVKAAYVSYPAVLKGNSFLKVVLAGDELSSGTVELDGTFADVEIEGDAVVSAEVVKKLGVTKKVSLVLQSGTIEALNVESTAKGATINLSKKTVVENANNKAAVSYTGSGTIEVANNEVTGVEFDGVTVDKETGKKGEGDSVGSKTDDEFFKEVEVTPSKGKTNQSISVNVVLTFLEEAFDKDGKKLTKSYVEDNFELRRSSATGTTTSFVASLASSNKKITLNPEANLKGSTTYYLVIPKGTLTYEDGTENDEYVTYFKTAAAADEDDEEEDEDDEDASVTMSPKNGAEDVSINTTIKLTFTGTLKAYSSSDTFDEEYVEEEAIKIYEDSTKGDEIDFSASISGKTITLTPDKLLGDTEYFVVILGNKIKVGGSTMSKTTMSFTTEEGLPIKISPESGDTGVSTMPEISISFAEPVLQVNKNHDALTEDYIQDEVILFRKSSATKDGDEYQVSYSVTEIAENGRKIVIVPDEELESGITYYIVIQDETLYGKTSGTENKKVTSNFKTASAMAPMFYPTDGKENVSLGTEIRISFSDELLTYSTKKDERVPVTNDYLEELVSDKKIALKRGSTQQSIVATIDDDGKTIIITPDNALLEEKTYTVSVSTKVFYSEAGKYNAAGSASFDTNEALSPTFTPKNDAEDVAVTVNPTIKFSERIFGADEDYRTLKPAYLKEAITFVDEYGNEVEFTASASDTTITVEPEEDLDGNVEYTLTLLAGKITNEEGVITNAEKSITFTTKVSYTIVIDPENKETAVSPLVTPTVRFGTEMFTADDEAVDADYAYDYIFMSEGKSASSVDASHVIPTTIEVGDDGRTFTIIPDEGLEFDTKYYINVVKNGFHYDDGKSNASASAYFTTIKEPALTNTKISSTTKTSVKITCTSNVKGVLVVEDENGTELATKDAKSGSNTVEIKGLTEGTEYNFSVYVIYDDEIESEIVEISATTKS